MTPISDFLMALIAGLPQPLVSKPAGVGIMVTDVDLTVPVESRIDSAAVLHASLPRGLMVTGFDPPLGCISARFVAEGATEHFAEGSAGAPPDEAEAGP